VKWFKHETDAMRSEKLTRLIDEFGLEGYGRFWRVMEIVAERMDESNRCHAELPEKEWLLLLSIRRPLFNRYLLAICQLFNIKVIRNNLLIRIEIPNLLEKRDNYTANLQATNKKLASKEVEVEVENECSGLKSLASSEVNSEKQKNGIQKYKFDDSDMELALFMQGRIKNLLPDFKAPNLKSWANEFRLIREQDNRGHEDIKDLFSWANNNDFWCANILSPAKFRKQWDTLTAQKNSNGNGYRNRADINSASSGGVVL
jgi:hypothetical protein